MQNVDLDAALGILVVRIIPYAQHSGVHLDGLFAAGGDWSARGCGGGLLEVGNRVVGAALGDDGVVGCAGDADVGGERGDARVVERRVAVVDAGVEVVVSADAEAREGDVGGGDAEFFGAAAEALDDGAAQFEGEGRLHRCGGLATEGVGRYGGGGMAHCRARRSGRGGGWGGSWLSGFSVRGVGKYNRGLGV